MKRPFIMLTLSILLSCIGLQLNAYTVYNNRDTSEIIYTEVTVTKSDDTEEIYTRLSSFFLGYGSEFSDTDIEIINLIVHIFNMPHNTLVGIQADVGAASILYVRFEDGERLPYIQIDKETWPSRTDQEKTFILAHEASHYVLGHIDIGPRDQGWFAQCRMRFGDNFMTQVGYFFCLGGLYSIFDFMQSRPLFTRGASLLLSTVCCSSCWLIASEFYLLQEQEKEADLYAVTKLNSVTGGMEFFEHEPWNATEAFLRDILCLTVHPSHAKRAQRLQEWRTSKMSH